MGRIIITVAVLFAGIADSPAFAREAELETGTALVKQLGSADFRSRELAETQLLALGIAIRPVLESAAKQNDPEIRSRATRVLNTLVEQDCRRRLQAFEDDADGSQGTTLPGWQDYSNVVGKTQDTRILFLKMHRAEYLAFDQLAAGADPSETLLNLMAKYDYTTNAAYQLPDRPNRLGSAATMLYLLQKCSPERLEYRWHERFAGIAATSLLMEVEGNTREPLQKLHAAWIYREIPDRPRDYAFRLYIALKWGIGRELVKRVLDEPGEYGSQVKGIAMLAAAMPELQGVVDARVLASYLYDESTVHQTKSKTGARMVPLELRDCALFSLIKNSQQNPFAYGFGSAKDQLSFALVANLDLPAAQATFATPELRTAAIEKWNAWLNEPAGQEWLEQYSKSNTQILR